MYEYRCDERLKGNPEESILLVQGCLFPTELKRAKPEGKKLFICIRIKKVRTED